MRIKGMREFSKQRVLRSSGIALLLFADSTRAQQAPVTCNEPLNETQVVQLLKAGVAEVRIEAFVGECGVNFTVTPEVENNLRGSGGSEALVKQVQARSRMAEKVAWEKINTSFRSDLSEEALRDFLKRFPTGQFALEARERLIKLSK